MRKIGFYGVQGWAIGPTNNYQDVAKYILDLDEEEEGMVAAKATDGGMFGDHDPLTSLEAEAFQFLVGGK